MPTTSNFGWTTPADTDLVKDGAAAIRTLGNGIDTSLVDLKGGTTGQVLSKASNTDLDFSWVAQDDSNAIQNALLTTTGDTIYASAASTPARLGLGTAGQVLTVNSGATAPEWITPASAGGMTLISTTTLANATVTLSSIPQTYVNLYLVIKNVTGNTNNRALRVLPNNVNNLTNGLEQSGSTPTLARRVDETFRVSAGNSLDRTSADNVFAVNIYNYTASDSFKVMTSWAFVRTTTDNLVNTNVAVYRSNTAITSLVLDREGTDTFAGGTVLLYGVK